MGNNPSHFQGEKNLPVEMVSWDDCQQFIKKLREKDKKIYRLPSEAEWEHACRAGTTTPFYFGETLTPEIVNYDGTHPYGSALKGASRWKSTPVGSFGLANAFGLYDMHGNVWEWCLDRYHEGYEYGPKDGSAWEKHAEKPRVLRGGSWLSYAHFCRAASRFRYTPDFRGRSYGFRVVMMSVR